MFGKRQTTSAAVTVIAAGCTFEGTLRTRGMIQIDGHLEGTLLAQGHVSIGPDGSVRGDVQADQISIGGKVQGTVAARAHLHVLATGVLSGEARYATLEVDRGGVMDGRAQHTDKTTTVPDNDVELITDAAAE